MFPAMTAELLQLLPRVPQQVSRIDRAFEEAERYQFVDRSDLFHEPAFRVVTLKGEAYVVFADSCTCPDQVNRGPVHGKGEIAFCKHLVASYLLGYFEQVPSVFAALIRARFEIPEPTPEPELPRDEEDPA